MPHLIFMGMLFLFSISGVFAQNCDVCAGGPSVAENWDESTGSGVVAGKKITCKSCFEAMKDSKGGWCEKCGVGHSLGRKRTCKECFSAMTHSEGGWCNTCKRGFAYALETTCKSCFEAMTADLSKPENEMKGWCKKCKVGYIHGTKLSCANCYCLMQSDGWCKACKVGYVHQQKVPCERCFQIFTSVEKSGDCMTCMRYLSADGQSEQFKCGNEEESPKENENQ